MTLLTVMNAIPLLCLLSMELGASAFQIGGRLPSTRTPSQWMERRGTTTISAANDKEASLSFICDTVYSSDPVPASTPQQVFEFFQQTAQRDCLVTAGNQRDVEVTETSDALLEEWKKGCQQLGAIGEPDNSDAILKVSTGGINFPGITLTSNAYIGAKLLEPTDTNFPVFEFVLVKDEQSVTGLKPAVWLFDKLVGANDENKNSNKPLSLSRVTAVPTEDGQIIFQSAANLTIKVKFPKLLLRLLPVSKEKAEEQGAAAVGKTLEKDLTNALQVMREAYLAQ